MNSPTGLIHPTQKNLRLISSVKCQQDPYNKTVFNDCYPVREKISRK